MVRFIVFMYCSLKYCDLPQKVKTLHFFVQSPKACVCQKKVVLLHRKSESNKNRDTLWQQQHNH